LHTATLLANGKVLITGGAGDGSDGTTSAEIYDPGTGSFSSTGTMSISRYDHTATLLASGTVLITGGLNSSDFSLASAELYDPGTGSFSLTASMTSVRAGQSATLLANGKILISGGYDHEGGNYWLGDTGLASAELVTL
jgi:N-acetylneuraminic acid mutarotase